MPEHAPAVFDWSALRTFLDDMAKASANLQDSTIARTPEIKRYVRFQRYVHRTATVPDPNASRDALIELAADFNLTPMQAKGLFSVLHHLNSSFQLGKQIEEIAYAGSFVKLLDDVTFSLSKLSKFAESILTENPKPAAQIAEKQLENAAHEWADTVRKEGEEVPVENLKDRAARGYDIWEQKAKPQGFVHRVDLSNGYPIHTYNSLEVVRTWLRNTHLFSTLVREIIAGEHRKPKLADADDPDSYRQFSIADLVRQSDGPTEIKALAGIELPRLYTRYTGKEYGFSRTKDGGLYLTTGPKFVAMCLKIMGLEDIGPEGLRKHWYEAAPWRGT